MRNYLRSIAPDVKRAAVVDREIQKEVVRINMEALPANELIPEETKPMDSNKTGFGGFKSIFGEGLGNLKRIASDLDEEMRSVVAEGQQVAEAGKQITEAARREIAEARAALAQFGNGGPE